MKTFAPNYYASFHCIAGECRHSCCIGWDVYIDEETLAKYRATGGELGARLAASICETDDGACFRMREDGRCPFLNTCGLCDIILAEGEGYISEICTEHPRFYNFFSSHAEAGLGLSCEEAARIILSQEEKTRLVPIAEDDEEEYALYPEEEYILAKRAEIFEILQNESASIDERVQAMLSASGASFPQKSIGEWAKILASLEMLDPDWGETLATLEKGESASLPEFERAFEKLLIYFIYRHTASAEDETDFDARVCFANLALTVIRALCAAKKAASGECSFADLCDFARRYSAEIEYSEENTEALIDIMQS